jgi:hypothetical protein
MALGDQEKPDSHLVLKRGPSTTSWKELYPMMTATHSKLGIKKT